jgi:hypothetical protein
VELTKEVVIVISFSSSAQSFTIFYGAASLRFVPSFKTENMIALKSQLFNGLLKR